MHSRGIKTIDPRIPTMPGRSMLGFHRPGKHRVHQGRSAARCSASRINGELNPPKDHMWGGLSHLVRTPLHVDDSFEWIYLFSGVGTCRDSLVDALPYAQRMISEACITASLPTDAHLNTVGGGGRGGGGGLVKAFMLPRRVPFVIQYLVAR